MEAGYIKLCRSLLKWEWYDDNNTKALFIHLLLSVNFTDGNWRGHSVKQGQIITSIPKLAIATGMTEQKVRTSLKKLQQTGEITIESTNRFTLINVVKFTFYQLGEDDSNIQVTDKQHANNGQVTDKQQTNNRQATFKQHSNNNNIRKIKKDKEREEGEERKNNDYQLLADMYNTTCVSFPKCAKLSKARKDALSARLKTYSIEDFKQLFEIAERSDFLKGANDRNWRANFDWLTADKNMPKVIEGRYENRNPKGGGLYGQYGGHTGGVASGKGYRESPENNTGLANSVEYAGETEGERLNAIIDQYKGRIEDTECDY